RLWLDRLTRSGLPVAPVEKSLNRFRNEPTLSSVVMPVTPVGLLVIVEPNRHDQVQFSFGSGHGDIEQPSFFFDFFGSAGCLAGRNAALDDIQDSDALQLTTL